MDDDNWSIWAKDAGILLSVVLRLVHNCLGRDLSISFRERTWKYGRCVSKSSLDTASDTACRHRLTRIWDFWSDPAFRLSRWQRMTLVLLHRQVNIAFPICFYQFVWTRFGIACSWQGIYERRMKPISWSQRWFHWSWDEDSTIKACAR